MSDSIQSQVMDAVVTVLGTNAYRCRMTAFAPSQLPADNVIPEDEESEYTNTDGMDHKFRFKVRHIGASVDEVDKAIDARFVAGYKAIMADTTLGGLVRVIRYLGKKWEMEKGELDQVALVVTYDTEFSTARSDPSVASY